MNKPYYQCPVCLQAFGTIEEDIDFNAMMYDRRVVAGEA